MRATILIAVLLFSAFQIEAQTHIISGRVIAELDIEPVPGVLIRDKNNLTLGQTDKDGRFRINIPRNTHMLTFLYLGFESARIYLTSDCDTVELVLIDRLTRDFTSPRKIDRERLTGFKNLSTVYTQAYQKGLFTHPAPCYTRTFEPEKPEMDSIKRMIKWEVQQVKLIYKKLRIDDTLRIPFFIPSNQPHSDTASLGCYSLSKSNAIKYDYIATGIIIGKNRHSRRYNLVIKITGCDLCKQPATLEGQPMRTGEVFTYNMGTFKVLTE